MALIDVQRLRQRAVIPFHFRVKDLAQLCYSALDTGNISRSDCLRFFLIYTDKKRIDKEDRKLIKKILNKVKKIERHTVKLLDRRRKRGEIR